MKANTKTDDFYAARLIRFYEHEEPRRPWDATLLCVIALALWGWFGYMAYAAVVEIEQGGTDSMVGCIDDCLEPAIEDEAQTLESPGRIES